MTSPRFFFSFILILFFQSLDLLHSASPPVVVSGNISRVEDAQYFHIYYGQSFKVIKNSIDGKSYLLIQRNSKMATRTKYCTGRIKSFVVPLANFSVDTVAFPVSFLELLGLTENLKGITSDSMSSPCILKLLQMGSIVMLNNTNPSQITNFSAHFTGISDQSQRCNFVTFFPSEEDTPLQRAEWIKYLGSFADAESRANTVYNAVKTNYKCLSNTAAKNSARFKPVVAWIQFKEGVWSFANEAHKLKFVEDASGENLDPSMTSKSFHISVPEDSEDLHAILCTVDVLIDETPVSNPAEYGLDTFLANLNIPDDSCFGFVTNQSLWRYDKRSRVPFLLDWYDGGISQPQLVLADLLEVFFPTGNYTTTYFRNLAREESAITIEAEMCDRDISSAMEPTIIPCSS